ncbi:hypothetical protein ACFPYJ_26355 [Paenibacillus solisilvae]|uniref:SMP-30/Gluconolactonase/LRE-like region domain-containing protein n=1 Tax=Paenibacillus solisilvae TaxID=2486751 RepID=A0ABW0W5Q1_9BACL
MIRLIRFITLTLLAVLAAQWLMPAAAQAAIPYEGYAWGKSSRDQHSINGYVYMESIDGYELESGPFKDPEGIFVAPDDSMYVADAGNNRVVHLNRNREVLGIIGDAEGDGALSEPKGVFVKPDGTAYVADTKNQRIAVFNDKGKFIKAYGAPKSPLLGANFTYSPSKLIVDKRNYMLVVSEGNTQGLLQIDANGDFKGYFGANHIGFNWMRLFVKLVASDEQKNQLAVQKPMEFSSLTQDDDGFVYTTTLATETNQIKRLSPVGVDTLNPSATKYGSRFEMGPFEVASFIGITVSPEGFITALDLQSSKIFQYDKLGNFLFAFGGMGEQNGLFKTPSSLSQLKDGVIVVVDKGRNRLDFFRTTPFANLVHQASSLYVEGQYEEAQSMWQDVLKQNANFTMAYQAIGKSLYKAENYEEAMHYFKLAKSKGDYSTAFREYRKEYTRAHFVWIALAFILLLVLLRFGLPFLASKFKKYAAARRDTDRRVTAAGSRAAAARGGDLQ